MNIVCTSREPATPTAWAQRQGRNAGVALLLLAGLCLTGCHTTRAPALRTLHAYEGALRPTNELVHIKVLAPIKVSFVDDAPVKVTGGEILALLPGTHQLMAGCPTKQHSGISFADNLAAGLSENKAIPVTGRAGDLFTLTGVDSRISITMNGMAIPLPRTYRAELNAVSNQLEVAAFFTGISTAVTCRLTAPFLDDPDNAREYHALQGSWRVTGINLEGRDYTADEFRARARAKNGDTTLLDMVLEIKGLHMKWTGKKVRGESIIVKIDAHHSPKLIQELSVANGTDKTCGIFDLQGDTLKYCFSATPPHSFTSAPEMARLSFVLQREATGAAHTPGGK